MTDLYVPDYRLDPPTDTEDREDLEARNTWLDNPAEEE